MYFMALNTVKKARKYMPMKILVENIIVDIDYNAKTNFKELAL